MARIQILQLPIVRAGGASETPFVVVVDEALPERYILGMDQQAPPESDWERFGRQIGARGVLVTPETIDIPANDTSAYPREGETEERAEPQRADERAIQAEEKLKAFMEKHYAIEQEHRAAITEALRIDPFCDWDDIRDAAAGLRRDRDAQAEVIERVRNLHRPVKHHGITICAECSGWDGHTADNSLCAYEHCPTLKALDGEQKQP